MTAPDMKQAPIRVKARTQKRSYGFFFSVFAADAAVVANLGTLTFARLQRSIAASYKLNPFTLAHKSSWFPLAPHVKQRNAFLAKFTENDRLLGDCER
jgi:hypothetical protein